MEQLDRSEVDVYGTSSFDDASRRTDSCLTAGGTGAQPEIMVVFIQV